MRCKLVITRTVDMPVEVYEFDGSDIVSVAGPFFEATVYIPANGGMITAFRIAGDVNVTSQQVEMWRREQATNDAAWAHLKSIVQ